MTLILQFPVHERFAGLVRHLAEQAAWRAGMGTSQVDDIKLAVTEVVSNAVESQRRTEQAAPLRVEIDVDPRFEVKVSDRGDGLDLNDVRHSPKLQRRSRYEGGLGLLITQALVDDLRVEPRHGGGSTVTAIVQRRG